MPSASLPYDLMYRALLDAMTETGLTISLYIMPDFDRLAVQRDTLFATVWQSGGYQPADYGTTVMARFDVRMYHGQGDRVARSDADVAMAAALQKTGRLIVPDKGMLLSLVCTTGPLDNMPGEYGIPGDLGCVLRTWTMEHTLYQVGG